MANKKFSEFVLKTSTSDVSHIVGYNGAENVQITPANFVTGGGTGVFLPLAGGTMTGDTVHNDNVKSTYGNSNDLQIYHDGTDSYIKELTAGSLKIWAKDFEVYNAGGTETLINADVNAGVQLFYDNTQRFATTNTGISVTGDGVFTGDLTATGGDYTSNGINVLSNSVNSQTLRIGDTLLASEITNVKIRTNGIDSLSINSLGNSAFAGNVTVSGNIEIDSTLPTIIMTDTDTGGFARIRASNGGLLLESDENNTQADSTTRFEIDGSEKMRLDSSGNLGVGTSSPGNYRLNVSKGAVGDVAQITDGVANTFVIRTDANTLYTGNANNLPLAFLTNNTERMRLDASGNLGLGSTAPTSKFEIEQSIVPRITMIKTGVLSWYVGNPTQGSSGNFTIGTDSGGNLDILTLDTSGKVGISNSSPSQPFVVKDGIAVTGASSEAASTTGDYILAVGKNTGDKSLHTQGDILCDGGIFLGGTAGANKLDDYEEGDWTPALGGTWTVNPTNLQGRYVKVGSTVTIYLRFTDGTKANTTDGYFTGLPFGTSYQGTGSVSDSGVNNRGICLFANTDRVWLSGTSFSSTTYAVGTYITND